MLDIRLFRENPDLIRKSEEKRFRDPKLVDKVIFYDNEWRKAVREVNELKSKRNIISREISEMKKRGEDTSSKIKEMQELNDKIKNLDRKTRELLTKRDEIRYRIGNILHDSVPVGPDESYNEIVREWGKIPKFDFKPKHHVDLVLDLNLADLEKAAQVSGSRFYYLKNDLLFLNLALIHLALNYLVSKGYTPFWTPYLIKKEVMRAVSELADFEEQLYKVEGEDLFLIATSEQTLGALHFNEIIDERDLPLKYTGFSTCFRREAGAHGKDTKGIFRVHQFDKVEQFVFCKPEDSWDLHEEMIQHAEKLYQMLELPYRVVNIASGEMNDNAAKKYDLEVWFPSQSTYREVVSCSNCTDYQARKLNIRYGRVGTKKEFVHTLNSTAIATERTICSILENYQREDGSVEIPKVLRKYMGGKKEILTPA
ncbi:MAG: serine--tRNA ligase [Candidatus Hydrothermarchaeota archaeon]